MMSVDDTLMCSFQILKPALAAQKGGKGGGANFQYAGGAPGAAGQGSPMPGPAGGAAAGGRVVPQAVPAAAPTTMTPSQAAIARPGTPPKGGPPPAKAPARK